MIEETELLNEIMSSGTTTGNTMNFDNVSLPIIEFDNNNNMIINNNQNDDNDVVVNQTNIIDTLNTFSPEAINDLIGQYVNVMNDKFSTKPIPEQAYVIDVCYKHIKTNHNLLNSELQSWCVYIIRKLYEIGFIRFEEEIVTEINNFVTFYKNNYREYLDNIESCGDVFDRDIGFVKNYIKTKTVS